MPGGCGGASPAVPTARAAVHEVLNHPRGFRARVSSPAEVHESFRLRRVHVPLGLHLHVRARLLLQEPNVLAPATDDEPDRRGPAARNRRRDVTLARRRRCGATYGWHRAAIARSNPGLRSGAASDPTKESAPRRREADE